MKKALLLLFSLLIISCNNVSCTETSSVVNTATTATKSILTDLKDAIVSDIKDTITTSVNTVKLENYKNQLEQKKAELKELEDSDTFFLIKIFKKVQLNSQIEDLELKIQALENKDSAEEKDTTTVNSEETK